MSESFKINSSIKSYEVYIVTDYDEHLLGLTDNDFILIDALVLKLWPTLNLPNLIQVDAIEENKTFNTVAEVIEKLRALGANRNSRLIAIGGGIIQDVATFVASSYMRGIKWVYLPTTLLGMADSCIGGKSSINVGQYKNIAGNFYPPEKIIVCTEFTQTLNQIEVIAGLCEAVKICFAENGSSFEQYLEVANEHQKHSTNSLARLIHLSLSTKKTFIEQDEFDQNIRLVLNFGHTFGHAIESATNFKVTHGIAVGLGMLSAIHFAKRMTPDIRKIERIQKLEIYIKRIISEVSNIQSLITELSAEMALLKFKSDKKHQTYKYVMIIPDQFGHLALTEFEKNNQIDQLIINSFESLNEIQ